MINQRNIFKKEKEQYKSLYIENNKTEIKTKAIITSSTLKCYDSYGYVANPKMPLWENIEKVLTNMTELEYYNRPCQMAYHNLCEKLTPPDGIGITLGLGLKFCVQSTLPASAITPSLNRFVTDVRTKFMFAGEPTKEESPKKMYVKSIDWKAPKSEEHMEWRINSFIKRINIERNNIIRKQTPSTNLTNIQQKHIHFLKNSKEFIILMADKNLGPCIMERATYIRNILNEHLTTGDTYQHLSEETADNNIKDLRKQLNKILTKHKKSMLDYEYEYFRKALMQPQRVPQFYGTPKVHKNKQPTPFRPVVAQCGSLSAIISTYIDYKLQKFTKSIPSYITNSTDLLNQLDQLNLPKHARLFTSDATSMYTNIDPTEGIEVLELYLNKYKDEVKDEVTNIELILSLTNLVMNNNVFQFGDTYWLQKIGTAMGTPCACVYAMIFFAWFERTRIQIKYKNNLIMYKRQIDDIFGIWIDLPNDNRQRWREFNTDLNSYCKLDWNTEDLTKSVNFLDLTIWIDDSGKLKYKTYQKPMNLFLYIPAHSAHPPGVLKSLIHGLVQTYHRQNYDDCDFQHNINKLFGRLLARGHRYNDILPIFLDAAKNVDIKKQEKQRRRHSITTLNKGKHPNKTQNLDNSLFFHLPYHPKEITRQKIQNIYNKTCDKKDTMGESFQRITNGMGGTMKINKLTIAYSRGKNLRDMLCNSSLQSYDDCKVSQFIKI
jgi:hypothetical protein